MVFVFGEYELDIGRFELRRGGEPQPVEPQVFDVLHYLVAHRDRVVTKNELLDNVWGDRFVSESALTSRIKAARRLLGDDGKSQSVIRTADGRGYRFALDVVEREDAATSRPMAAPAARGDHATTTSDTEPPADTGAATTEYGWPLMGRRSELEQLASWFHDESRGGVLLVGAAGLGKTRLAEELVAVAAAAGLPTARAAGHPEARSIPLAAFAHLIPPEAIATTGDTAVDQATLFYRARAALEGDTRRLLFVDDVDQLDELSRALLGSLIADRAVFVVLTMRSRPTPVPTVEHLVKDGHLTRLELQPLPPDTAEALLHRTLGGPLLADTTRQLVDASLGNPGILRQLVESSLAAGRLSRMQSIWKLTGPLATPPSLASLLADRLDELEGELQHGVELLAVAGGLGLELLAELTGDDVPEELERRGLIRVRNEGRRLNAALSHPLYDEIVRSALPTLRVRRLKRELVDAVTAHGARRLDDRIRVVAWQLDAGGEVDPALLLQSATLAMLANELDTAERILTSAARSDPSAKVVQLQAELAFRQGSPRKVEQLLGSIDLTPLDDHQRAQIFRRRATNIFFETSDYHEATAMVDTGLETLRGPTARGSLDAHLSMLLATGGQVGLAIERATAALPEATGETRLELLRTLGLSLVHAARPLAGLELAREGEQLHASLPDTPTLPGISMLLFVEVAALAAAGQVDAARARADAVCRDYPNAQLRWIDTAIGRLELMAGRTADARRVLEPTINEARANRHGSIERWVLALHAYAHLMEGHPDLAEPELERVATLEVGARALYHPEIDRAHAWLAASRGDLDKARQMLVDSAADCDARGATGMVALLLHDVARLGFPELVVDRLNEIAAASDGSLFAARSLLVTGTVKDDADMLDQALTLFEDGGCRMYAAETAATLADVHRRAGRDNDADEAARRADLLRQVGDVTLVSPALR